MSVADDIQGLADLAESAAHQALGAQIKLGPRPSAPDPAGLLWDQTTARLQAQVNSLTALATNLSADSVIDALADNADAVAQLEAVTANADAAIQQIDDTSKLLTTIGHILDVGVAVLALAAAPTEAAAQALFGKIKTLSGDF